MKMPSKQYWLICLLLRAQKFKSSGFTLLELLVTLLIGSIIITGLLYLVVEMLQIEQRETAIDNTQRDIQRALDYMASDLREAVHVYSDPINAAAVTGLDDLPANPSTTVLAFWRPDPVDDTQIPDCSTTFTSGSDEEQECEVLQVRKSAYTLVVYQLLENDGAGTTSWEGQSRIVRYELPKYRTVSTLEQTSGYQEPIDPDPSDATVINFANWTPTAANTDGNAAVLVDFVDSPNGTVDDASVLDCPVGMQRSPNPATVTATSWTSFFACVRDPDVGGVATNQDVEIFLRGNFEPEDGGGSIRALSESSGLPTLRAGILVRGVIDKDPD
jgi:prepilin-type N-terminal cleavage/methylation domain-containing protein